jgi:iron complex transport system substrate-binding protein
MKKISVLVLAIVSLAVASCKKEEETKKEETPVEKTEALKIVSLNGAVTEIIAALGHEKEIVGVDVTSTYPETVKTTAKDLGHVRSITIESIVALKPTVIIGN